jgi:hypothetical protein
MNIKQKTFRSVILLFAFANIFLSNIALAQTSQTITDQYSGPEATIRQYLCTPSPNSGGTTVVSTNPNPNQPWTSASVGGQNNPNAGDLYNCINRVYRFAIVFAAIAAVLYIVIAGYLYMSAEGNGETVEKAKSLVTSSITALVILFAGYILLKALNPDLISFKNIQPPSVTPATTTAPMIGGTPPAAGGGNVDLSNCQQSLGSAASAGCTVGTNCTDVSAYTPTKDCQSNNGVCLLSGTAAAKAKTFINTFNQLGSASGCSLKISSAIQVNGGPSISGCHKTGNGSTGTCLDFNLNPSSAACQQVFYQAAKQSGAVVSFLNEYVPACVKESTTGGNIHVNF